MAVAGHHPMVGQFGISPFHQQQTQVQFQTQSQVQIQDNIQDNNLQPVHVSVIVPGLVQPAVQPVPVLQPAEPEMQFEWANDNAGK